MEAPFKNPDPQGPFATERFLMPLVTGWTPRGLVGDTEEDAVSCLPDDAVEPSTEGGAAHHATTDQYPLTKALPGLAGIGHNWGVECTAHTGIPSRRGWSDQLVR